MNNHRTGTVMKKFCILLVLGAVAASAPHPATAAEKAVDKRPVYVIPVEGMIESALLYVIRRGVAEAEQAGAGALILRMETPGGTIDAAEEIVRTLENLSVPTYTLVDKNAISAGAIIALATDHIYMTPGSKIGDAMPIMMTPFGGVQEMPEGTEEKMLSYVAGLIRATAQNKGHDDKLAEAMVRREIEYKIGDEVISPEGQLLTLTNVEAERKYGKDQKPLLSSGTVESLEELLKAIGMDGAEIREMSITSAERIARFIAALGPIFLIIGLLGIYIEVKTPGFGLPGMTGIVALAIFFWGHHIAGLAGMEDMLIFLLGILLLLLEIFVFPGFGVAGMLGVLCVGWALLNAMVQHYPGTPWYPDPDLLYKPFLKLTFSLIGTVLLAMLLGRWISRHPATSKLVLAEEAAHDKGFVSSANRPEDLVGLQGIALTDLRPGGTGMFGERKLDIVSRGNYIESGTTVRIVESHGMQVIVEPLES